MSTVVVKKTSVFVIVPVKGLANSKERLSPVLNPEERKALTAAMLENVLNALDSSDVREVFVVSSDSNVRQIADKHKFSHISTKRPELNPALAEAIEWCMQKNASSVLILPADVPLVSPKDINRLIELGSQEKTVVLSPSLNGGTNAILLNPPNLIPVIFGTNSFFKHVKEAINKRVTVKFHSSRELILDVDSADDLNKLLEMEDKVESKRVLKQLRISRKRELESLRSIAKET